jgi:hypothetical protein
MVNSVARLQEMKAFMRTSSGLDLQRVVQDGGGLRFTDRNCRADTTTSSYGPMAPGC